MNVTLFSLCGFKCNCCTSVIVQKCEVLLTAAVTVGKSAKVVCASFSPKFFHIQEQSQYGSFMMLHIKS